MWRVKKIVCSGGLGTTPAAAMLKTGIIYINPDKFKKLPHEQKVFVVLHEMGHINHNTRQELVADDYARNCYYPTGLSLRQSVWATTRNLTHSPGHLIRMKHALINAFKYDKKKSTNSSMSNKKKVIANLAYNALQTSLDTGDITGACEAAGHIVSITSTQNQKEIEMSLAAIISKEVASSFDESEEVIDFGGVSMNALNNISKDVNKSRKKDPTQTIDAIGAGINAAGSLASGIANTVQGIKLNNQLIKNAANGIAPTYQEYSPALKDEKTNKKWWVAGGLVSAFVIGTIIFFVIKNKK